MTALLLQPFVSAMCPRGLRTIPDSASDADMTDVRGTRRETYVFNGGPESVIWELAKGIQIVSERPREQHRVLRNDGYT